jgi:(2Fe-2S) ferredoxin
MIRSSVLISGDPISLSRGAEDTKLAIEAELSFYGLEDEVQVGYTGRVNRTDVLPVVVVYPEGTVYGPVKPKDGVEIVDEHLYKGRVVNHLTVSAEVAAAEIDGLGALSDTLYGQKRIVLRRAGSIDPYSIDDYIAEDGYFALASALTEMTADQVL